MPRRTRRTDDLSAAEPSDAINDGVSSSDSPVEQSSPETPAPTRTRTPSVRRRPPSKAVAPEESVEASPSEAPPSPTESATAKRTRRRRPPRKAATLVVDASTASEVESETQDADLQPSDTSQPDTAKPSSRNPVPRRRVGGRRSVTEAAVASGESPVTEPPSVSEETAARTGRNRRRRGQRRPEQTDETEVVIVEAVEELDVAAGTEDDPFSEIAEVEEALGTEEDQKRSRRSRRGGRRRTGRVSEGDKAVDVETADVVETLEDDDPLIPLFTPTQVWKAPDLVPSPAALGLSPAALLTSATLADDVSGLIINGSFYGPEFFFVNAETADDPEVVGSQIALAASVGLHLHSGVAYLPLKNAYGNRSFTSVETLLKQLQASDADGYLVIRLQLVPTNFWARTHPEEMAKYSDGSDGDVSFASKVFWSDSVDAVSALVHFLADPATVGGDRVIGIHLDKGEWFNDANAGYDLSAPNKDLFQSWLHEKYQNVFALRASWFNGLAQFDTAEIPKWPGAPNSRKKEDVVLYNQPRERRFVDYNSYTSDVMAQAITGMAEAVKWLSGDKLLVSTSYGYTFEFAARNDSGHQSLAQILSCPAINIIAGPNSYATRGAGAAGAFASPIDSAQLHGKMWLVEDDTKTYLAADETEDNFNPKVSSMQDTLSVLRRNASAANVHGCGIVWMDLWGKGWLNSPEIWSEIAELRSQAVVCRRMKAKNLQAVPDVAVLVDEASYAYVRGDGSGAALQTGLINKSRELLYRSGASIGFYLQSDVALLPEKIKLYVFLNALRVTTRERQAIRERLQKPGKTLAWIYGPGIFDEKGDSPAEVSEIVGMPLKAQPWSSHIGTIFTEERHPVTERLHGGKRLGTDDILNPSYSVVDPAAIVLGEYVQTGTPSISSKINEGGWKSVFIGEPHLTGELLRGLYRFAGIHVYDAQDDIVHTKDNGLLLVHSPYTGQRTIHLPKPAAVYSLYEQRLVTQQSSTFRAFMRGRSTSFFLWGEIDQIASALGTSADELKEQQAAWKADRDVAQQRGQRHGDQRLAGSDIRSDDQDDGGSGEVDFSDEQDSQEQEGSADESQFNPAPIQVTSGLSEVSHLVESGLIADSDLVESYQAEEEAAPQTTGSPSQSEQMSPSRRRRWNRKRNMQAAKDPAAPVISMEDLLSDLPPRKSATPRTDD
jgi:uncharacterized protein (UPF0147 family)